MKRASTIARYLLGLIFTVFGLNGFLHFIPSQPIPDANAVQFFTAVSVSHFIAAVFAVQLVAGLLLLAGRFVPLALTLLAAVLFNILDFHLTMNLAGIAPGLVALVLWILVFFEYRASFRHLLASVPEQAGVSGSSAA